MADTTQCKGHNIDWLITIGFMGRLSLFLPRILSDRRGLPDNTRETVDFNQLLDFAETITGVFSREMT
jgi:hypothetical protein